jgi:hypothetical protein
MRQLKDASGGTVEAEVDETSGSSKACTYRSMSARHSSTTFVDELLVLMRHTRSAMVYILDGCLIVLYLQVMVAYFHFLLAHNARKTPKVGATI